MFHWSRRLVGGGLFAAQILLLAVVPAADARLEADTLEPHLQAPATAAGVHDSHASHDHRLCELCRALSLVGEPGRIPEPAATAAERWLEPFPIPETAGPSSPQFLPGSPRAPPVA